MRKNEKKWEKGVLGVSKMTFVNIRAMRIVA